MPNHLAYSRLGLIVAKKVERSAVKRNWVKRLLREVFRLNQQDERTKNLDWVIRLRCATTRNDAILLTTEAKSLMLKLQKCHD